MVRFIILLALAGAALVATPGQASIVATVSLDTHDPADDDNLSGPVFTQALDPGQPYLITVSGTYSVWKADTWGSWTGENAANVCAGQAEQWPQAASPAATNGPVGVDPEYIFAWIDRSAGLCPGGVPAEPPPLHLGNLQISLDGGASWQHLEPVHGAYDSGHAYQYLVLGLGSPAAIGLQFTDFPTSDNYGLLTATAEEADARAFATGGGSVLDEDGGEASFGLSVRQKRNGIRGSFDFEGSAGTIVEADSIDLLLVFGSGGTAYVAGTASIDGDPGHPFALIVGDNGEPGAGVDTFRLQVDGALLVGEKLTDGNVQVHAR